MIKKIFLVMLISLFITGCSSVQRYTEKGTPDIDKCLIEDSKQIKKSSIIINENTDEPIIKTELIKLDFIRKDLLKQVERYIDYTYSYQKILKENKKLKDDINRFIKKQLAIIWTIAIFIAFLAIVGGIAIIIISKGALSTLGIQISLIGANALAIAYVLAFYPEIAIIGGSIILVIQLIYIIKTVLNANKRFENEMTEVVRTAEIIKNKKWDDKTKKEISIIQSPQTIKTISKIKKRDNI